MDKTIILKTLNGATAILALPLAIMVMAFSSKARTGWRTSTKFIVRCTEDPVLAQLISALEFSEDHRYRTHWGVDPIAIGRALAQIFAKRWIQGASTIEQQYVRTCTGNREISIRRKVEEASISLMLALCYSKDDVAHSYLKIGFFGEGIQGYERAIDAILPGEFGSAKEPLGAAAVVALLKRPRPKHQSALWLDAHRNRVYYVVRRQAMAFANNSL